MLILVAGITGNIGNKLIEPLYARGQQIRGLGRNKDKLLGSQLAKLESFHSISTWYDADAIRLALKGVDAVICTYAPHPTLALEAQLLLVRLMEEEGVTRFIASAYNLDWTGLSWGDVPYYDTFLSFKRQVEMTSSTIKPFYIFVGILAETFFSVPGHGGFAPLSHGVWDPVPGAPKAEVWGTGDEKWQLTTEQNTADYTAEVTCDLSQKDGGTYRFCSCEATVKEIAAVYEQERGCSVTLVQKGSIADLKKAADGAQEKLGLLRFWEWMGYYYQLNQLNGKTMMYQLDNDRYPKVKAVGLVEFLKQNLEI